MSAIILQTGLPGEYPEKLHSFLSGNKGRAVIFLALDNAYSDVMRLLKERGFDAKDVFFIDSASRNVEDHVLRAQNCLFVGRFQSVTVIALAVEEVASSIRGRKVLVVDSLASFVKRGDAETDIKLFAYLVKRMRALEIDVVFLTGGHVNSVLLEKMSAFVDSVETI